MCPTVSVEPDSIYVQDGNVWTSAGVTSGIDLALALVADDHGRQAAATVAQRLVVYLRRSGRQRQFSALLAAQSVNDEPIRDLLEWLPDDHLTDDLSIPAMAVRAHLSSGSSAACSRRRSASPPRTTRRRCDWKRPATCSRRP